MGIMLNNTTTKNLEAMKTRLEKHIVCVDCQSIGITDVNCICVDSNRYETIELEFEVCDCCGSPISDFPADTEFNRKQLSYDKE